MNPLKLFAALSSFVSPPVYQSHVIATSSATTLAFSSLPSGLSSGDLMIAVMFGMKATSWTQLTGWTKLGQQTVNTNKTGCIQVRAWQAGDTAPTFTCSNSGDNNGILMRVSGAKVDNLATDLVVQAIATASTPATIPSITPNTASSLLITAACHKASDSQSISAAPTVGGSAMTTIVHDGTNEVWADRFNLTSTSATGTLPYTIAGTTAETYAVGVAIRPV